MASKLNLPTIDKGATYRHELYIKTTTYTDAVSKGFTGTEAEWYISSNSALSLTGCTGKLQVRDTVDSSIVRLELSTENSGMLFSASYGKITLSVSSITSTALIGTGGVYDLEIYFLSGVVTRLIEGKIKFNPEVTR